MGIENINLTGKDILEKKFKTGMRGYNQEEVDEFLDIVIQDYEHFQQEIDRLQQENERLRIKPDQPRQRERVSPSSHQVNYDILKRVSNLEKAVFGRKIADNEE